MAAKLIGIWFSGSENHLGIAHIFGLLLMISYFYLETISVLAVPS